MSNSIIKMIKCSFLIRSLVVWSILSLLLAIILKRIVSLGKTSLLLLVIHNYIILIINTMYIIFFIKKSPNLILGDFILLYSFIINTNLSRCCKSFSNSNFDVGKYFPAIASISCPCVSPISKAMINLSSKYLFASLIICS